MNRHKSDEDMHAESRGAVTADCGWGGGVQGFIGRTARGETCLLGRGGSDTSGSLFAGAECGGWG